MKRDGKQPFAAGLGLRLALMVILALLPLGLLSLGQTRNLVEQSARAHILAAMGETAQAALPEVLQIREAQSMARGLAQVLGQPDGLAMCQGLVDTAAAAAAPAVAVVAFVPASGRVDCASTASARGIVSGAGFDSLIAASQPQIRIVTENQPAGEPVLETTHPVSAADGGTAGYVSVTLPQRALGTARLDGASENGDALLALTTFDEGGEVLTSTLGREAAEAALPRTVPLVNLAGKGRQSFFGVSPEGERRLYTVMPIAEGLYLLGTWRGEGRDGLLQSTGMPYLFPALMWLAGLAVALYGAERLVLRHLRRLSRAMRGFVFDSRGSATELVLDDPPAEIASLAETYQTLIDTILRDEAELENLLRQKAELLREVHHRTGNSLQLIASILRMHRRETSDPAMRQLIDALHDRVISLSRVHLGLYKIAGRADVAMDGLLAEVIAKVGAAQQVRGPCGARRPAIRAEMVPMTLTAQQAVPLAMLVGEMLAVFPTEEHGPGIALNLTLDEGNMGVLTLTGSAAALATLNGTGAEAPSVIATRLIRSFVAQLDGEMTVTETGTEAEPLVEARVRFRIRLAAPEAAQATAPAEAAA